MSLRLKTKDNDPRPGELRGIVDALFDIGDFIKKDKVFACFPQSMGAIHPDNLSRIVYHEP